jgi:hypothetical protein
MRSRLIHRSLILIALSLAALPATKAQEGVEPLDQAAMKLARELTTAGAKLFERGDGAALAAQYVDDGEIIETTVEPFGAPAVKIHRGMEAIKKIYGISNAVAKLSPTNEVRYARFIKPDTLVINGDFLITDQGKTSRFHFNQVRRKESDTWKIVSLELIIRK